MFTLTATRVFKHTDRYVFMCIATNVFAKLASMCSYAGELAFLYMYVLVHRFFKAGSYSVYVHVIAFN